MDPRPEAARTPTIRIFLTLFAAHRTFNQGVRGWV